MFLTPLSRQSLRDVAKRESLSKNEIPTPVADPAKRNPHPLHSTASHSVAVAPFGLCVGMPRVGPIPVG